MLHLHFHHQVLHPLVLLCVNAFEPLAIVEIIFQQIIALMQRFFLALVSIKNPVENPNFSFSITSRIFK
jgi:hypothetical protein